MIGINQLLGIALLSIVLIGFGIALAMWSETLRINTYVNTGEVKVKWSEWYCSDTGPDPQDPEYSNNEGKDVAKCIVSVEEYDQEGNPIKLNITIVNAYPGYSVDVVMIVDNIGTIPVKLYNLSFTHWDPEDSQALYVYIMHSSDTQIEPGGVSTYTLHVSVLQSAQENSNYSFDVELTFAQWNEVP